MSEPLVHLRVPDDCRDVLPELPDNYVDSIVTDPPYELGFMGKRWDGTGIAYDVKMWAECLRVLKPGGHLLSFGGTRTWHRLTAAVEDAGFEIRDSIAWLYGSGFPKSLDVSKAIDKRGGTDGRWFAEWLVQMRTAAGLTRDQVSAHFPSRNGGTTGKVWNWEHGLGICTQDEFDRLCDLLGRERQSVFDAEGEFISARRGTHGRFGPDDTRGNGPRRDITAPATDAAREWSGWGTALKPGFEPVVVGRKPLAGTVAANVLEHSTGALNIDACRVGDEIRLNPPGSTNPRVAMGDGWRDDAEPRVAVGRWPTNVALDGDTADELDAQNGVTLSSGGSRGQGGGQGAYGVIGAQPDIKPGFGDSGGPSRFFPVFRYQAKAPSKERPRVDGVAHPTVKPLELMRWLVRLVTPPGGVVLDPFAGSGTTVEACLLEGYDVIAIEQELDYLPLIQARIERVRKAP